MRRPLKLQFANHFIIYQKRPFRGRFRPGRLHSELWARGVKYSFVCLYFEIQQFEDVDVEKLSEKIKSKPGSHGPVYINQSDRLTVNCTLRSGS